MHSLEKKPEIKYKIRRLDNDISNTNLVTTICHKPMKECRIKNYFKTLKIL
jgi:hypothetical protein